MDEKTYRIINSISLAVGTVALMYIGVELSDIRDFLWDLVVVIGNQ